MRVVWTVRADRDVDAIWEHIAEDSLNAADEVCERLRAVSAMLRDHPQIGRRGQWSGTRELVISDLPYFLVYRISEAGVEILRVIHGAQHWPPM
jgi:toxin ParE1/3/4